MTGFAEAIAEGYAVEGAAIDLDRGVQGVFFVTQVPDDVPGEVLGQLGNRVQHALRAFTPDDAKALKAAASTYPTSDFYDVKDLLTSMGIGEAAVTILSEDGVPTPVVHTRLRAPASRIGPADDVRAAAEASPLFAKYGARAESESAREKLAARLESAEPEPAGAPKRVPRRRRKEAATASTGGVDVLGDTKEELLDRARALEVKGRSRMTKQELGEAIKKANDRESARALRAERD